MHTGDAPLPLPCWPPTPRSPVLAAYDSHCRAGSHPARTFFCKHGAQRRCRAAAPFPGCCRSMQPSTAADPPGPAPPAVGRGDRPHLDQRVGPGARAGGAAAAGARARAHRARQGQVGVPGAAPGHRHGAGEWGWELLLPFGRGCTGGLYPPPQRVPAGPAQAGATLARGSRAVASPARLSMLRRRGAGPHGSGACWRPPAGCAASVLPTPRHGPSTIGRTGLPCAPKRQIQHRNGSPALPVC